MKEFGLVKIFVALAAQRVAVQCLILNSCIKLADAAALKRVGLSLAGLLHNVPDIKTLK